MRSITVFGASGKDVHIKIKSINDLPEPFKKYIHKTIAYSKIPELYGGDWTIDKVLKTLERLAIEPIYYSYGGRAPHVAYGIAKLGGKVRLVTAFGWDFDEPYRGFFGGGYWSHLVTSGVKMSMAEIEIPDEVWSNPNDLRKYLSEYYGDVIHTKECLVVKNRETSTIVCCKDKEGNCFFYIDDIKGVSYIDTARPAPEDVIQDSDIIFVTTAEPQFMEGVIKTAYKLGKEVAVDIGSYGVTDTYLRGIIPLSRIVFGNSYEIGLALRAFGLDKYRDLINVDGTGYPEILIVEDKINGIVYVLTESKQIKVGPIPLRKSGNSVGCCDGIAAGFLFMYQRGRELKTCAKAGLTICASIWEVEGVQEGIPNYEDFTSKFKHLFG